MILPKQILKAKYTCSKCGKSVFSFNMSEEFEICHLMLEEHLCWECAYWKRIAIAPPKNLEIINDKCYLVYPFIDKESKEVEQILGGNGKTYYILKRTGECIRTNDIWLMAVIPMKYQTKLRPTGWWVNKKYYTSLERSRHKCYAKGCMDRYHCYRYQYQKEFGKEPYNKVPLDWIVGNEHCPAFLPLTDIQGYDEYTNPSDLSDKSSVNQHLNNYE